MAKSKGPRGSKPGKGKSRGKPAPADQAAFHLGLARQHFDRFKKLVSSDWAAASLFAFYALENAVSAAAHHTGLAVTRKHWEKAELAERLADDHRIPDISQLLSDLNATRKEASYGDVEAPDLNPTEVHNELEGYIEAVATLLGK